MRVSGTRFPPWLRKRLPGNLRTDQTSGLLADLRLHTVCQGARCPNLCECFARGTATFLILGDVCTRNCRFCAIPHGAPKPPDPDEPHRIAEAARRMRLSYVVITSVTRDDLPDGGAEHFAATVRAVRDAGITRVEVLTPDFCGDAAAIDVVLAAEPTVYNHNVETVPRLYPRVRPEADYARSLDLLQRVARSGSAIPKSGLMVGLGETEDEVQGVFEDLAAAGCEMLTIGQYLQPSGAHAPVERFIEPEEFERYRAEALRRGLRWVESGPFVRSSYCAESAFDSAVSAMETR